MDGTVKAVRFPVVEAAKLMPGACFTCRSHRGPFIDTQIDKPIQGRIYLCVLCVKEMARMFGMEDVKPVQASPDLITKEDFEETVNGFRDTLASGIDALSSYLASVGASVNEEAESGEPGPDDQPLFDLTEVSSGGERKTSKSGK